MDFLSLLLPGDSGIEFGRGPVNLQRWIWNCGECEDEETETANANQGGG